MTKDVLYRWGMNALIIGLVACIPAGLFLAYWFDNPNWLMLCGTLILVPEMQD